MVEIKNVSVFYNQTRVLKDINLTVKEGECILICGKSGGGKTSLTNVINGLIPHYYECDFTGEICINQKSMENRELYEISTIVSSVFQNPKTHFFNIDTTTELVFFLENIGYTREKMKSRLLEMLEVFPIKHLMDRNIFELSGGEKQILSIASSYISGTDILVLDEPSSNLDNNYTEIVSKMLHKLKEIGKTIIIAEHRINYILNIVDRIIYVDDGEIKYIWNKDEFINLSDVERKTLGLRSLLKTELKIREEKINEDNFFEIENLEYEFTNMKRKIHIKDKKYPLGSIVGVVGKNGIGKSTFVKSLIGMMKKSKVNVKFLGKSLSKKELLKMSSLVMQDVNHQLFTDSVDVEIKLGIKDVDEKKVEDILNILNLSDLRDRHPFSLSGGQKQRVAVASVIMKKSNLIFFDEPTSGMDYENMLRISELIKSCSNKENIIFVISHDNEFLNEIADFILNIEDFSKNL